MSLAAQIVIALVLAAAGFAGGVKYHAGVIAQRDLAEQQQAVCSGAASTRTLAPLVSTLGIGQLILEGIKGKRWVHVSSHTPEKAINRIITITDSGVRVGIHPVD